MRHAVPIISFLALIVGFSWTAARGADWERFRGPDGNGISTEKGLPLEWSNDKNVKWKVELPQPGNASPIVAGDCVFITCAQDQGQKRSLYCFDRNKGEEKWVQTVTFDEVMPTHKTNPYCGSTPVSDGKRVIVWHGSAGLYCYDKDGNQLWMHDVGTIRHQWGYGSSPIIYQDRVYLNCGPGERTFMLCVKLDTGEQIWSTPEAGGAEGGKPKLSGSWSTPLIVNIDGKDQLVCSMPTRIVSYDLDTGDIIWSCDGIEGPKGKLVYSSPVITDGLAMVIGGYGGPSFGMKLGGTGDVTESNRLWRKETNPQSIGTGVVIGDYYYNPAATGVIQCIEVKSGDIKWTARGGGNFWGSIVLAGDRAYVTNQQGTTVVFRPNPEEYEELARNDLKDGSNSTPAVSDGQVFIHTDGYLWCIEEAK